MGVVEVLGAVELVVGLEAGALLAAGAGASLQLASLVRAYLDQMTEAKAAESLFDCSAGLRMFKSLERSCSC